MVLRIFIFSFLIFVIILIFFHSLIIKKITISVLENVTEKKIFIDDINIDFKSSLISLNSVKIFNSNQFKYRYFFTCRKIDLKINVSSIFSNLVEFEDILFYEPKIYLDIKNQNTNNKKDNISELEKSLPTYKPKIYPTKENDRNILIKKGGTLKPKANLNYDNIYTIEDLKLSEMELMNVGNGSANSQHFKDVFKLILFDLYFRIPDQNIKNKLKKIYKLKI